MSKVMTITIMDGSGDTPHRFEVDDPQAMMEARALFERLRSQGLNAYAEQPGGTGGGLRDKFNPEESVVFHPNAVPG